MKQVVRTMGKVLRLVGISSPDDAAPKPKAKGDPPSWRDAPEEKPDVRKE